MEDIFVNVTEQNKPLAEFISSLYKVKKLCIENSKKDKHCHDLKCPFHWKFSICSHGCLYVNTIYDMLYDIENTMSYNELYFKEGIDLDFNLSEEGELE